MMNLLYRLLWLIATPLIRVYLHKRAQKNPEYLKHWPERFGQPYPNPMQKAIWIHAVSVGETRAAEPLIAALRVHFPNAPLLITQMTPTGRAIAEQLYPQAQCRYLPYDRADWVQQFLREHQPLLGILMETEIWPNLMQGCLKNEVPLFLANARLSEKSLNGYQKILPLIQPAMNSLSACFAQNEEDARRLQQIGTINPQICGNTKFDIAPPPQSAAQAETFKQRIGHRRVFLAASTRVHRDTDEAELILQAWQRHKLPDALLVIVPRHPEHFQAAFDTAQRFGFKVQKRSDEQPVLPETQVWIGDSMGEMFAYYQAADAVFVGGSLVDTGCQNIIEPLSCGKAVAFGFSTYNFQAACTGALASGAAVQVQTASELVHIVSQWFTLPESTKIQQNKAIEFVQKHRGSGQKMADLIANKMKEKKKS
ncbi:MAG: lipid IV(A) 3-deoxy-D-manno-octulosonic acid transferase [Alysiella sp.]|uniref:lipid IV(A) 3-deoxy-D-manno-octulosonic acid transferase n=1 Tax=Alysiella sp. TaxID=1872483 RepID=UPI0026DC1548|nr:lipid IV(A) 3-deoxy-D-manno-octulosonic acid transferase [Alysiella sp.]MDO4433966.1 lipid IV(A) 3-deoxy-D-manno-octulosonic acid transferase [Alysiella sp.]